MKQARIELAMAGYRVDRELTYDETAERNVLMGVVRAEIGKHLRGLKRVLFRAATDRRVWRRIVQRENDYFNRRPRDVPPETWPDFRAWAIRRNYLRITEADDGTGTCAEPPEEVARKP